MSSTWTDDLVPAVPVARPSAYPSTPSGAGPSGAIVTLVVVVILAALAIPVASFVRDAKSFWPEHWDPRIAPIAQRDEHLRGLKYKHPVAVRFLPEKAFVKLMNVGNKSSPLQNAEIERGAATFRTLGFIAGSVDLRKAAAANSDASVIAFYDDDLKEIVVRGTKLDVGHRATLAHELTHVLQDQYFDLPAIQQRASLDDQRSGGSASAMLAVIEGDANHVEAKYVKALSPADRKEYVREQQHLGKGVTKGLASVPPFVSFLFGAPYEYGPLAIRVLIASGGNSAVNAALTGPTPTSAIFVQTGLTAAAPGDIAAPGLAAGERAAGPPEAFGAFELYLAFAMRMTPASALAAADVVLGGRARGLRKGATYCYRATVETRDAPSAALVALLGRQWAASTTRGSVRRSGTSVTLTACDPGRRAPAPPKEKLRAADELLAVRGALTAEAAESHVAADIARCAARLIVREPGALAVLEKSSPTPTQVQHIRTLARDSALQCRDNPDAGLP